MIGFGWLQERFNPPDRTETVMMPFWFGTVAGIAAHAVTTNVRKRRAIKQRIDRAEKPGPKGGEES